MNLILPDFHFLALISAPHTRLNTFLSLTMAFDADRRPEIRGMFGNKGDSMNWLDATGQFPNGVPRFESRDECLEFMKEYNTYHGGSNPELSAFKHIFTLLITWQQVETILASRHSKSTTGTILCQKGTS